MAIERVGIQNVGAFKPFEITPHQAIIVGRRFNGTHIVTAEQSGNYIYDNLRGGEGDTGNIVTCGTQFMGTLSNYDKTSVIPLLPQLFIEDHNSSVMLLSAHLQIATAAGNTNRRYFRPVIKDGNNLANNLYAFGFAVGSPGTDARLNLAYNTCVAMDVFDTTPDNLIWPALEFNLQEGDSIMNWSLNCVLQ